MDLFLTLVSAIPSLIPSEKLTNGLNYFFAWGGEGRLIVSLSALAAEIDLLGWR